MDPVYDEFIMVERGGVLEKILDRLEREKDKGESRYKNAKNKKNKKRNRK